MTATNHALTGALIGLATGSPWIAAPAAYLSHYALDAIPHFGNSNNPGQIKTRAFRNYLIADAVLCILLVAILVTTRTEHWLLASVCAFLATMPDMFWINKYLKARQGRHWRPNWHSRFAAKIQWYEKPEGAFVEFAWFCMAVALLLGFL